MRISEEQKQIHRRMWNKMDINAMKQYLLYLNPQLNMKAINDNMYWNDLLDLDYDRAFQAFVNCLNGIY